MTTAAFPREQHWTVNEFRVSVLVYKSHRWERCATCGAQPAIHAVWADGRGTLEGYRGGPANFCDAHRPAKGTLPPLNYQRLLSGGGLVVYEALTPDPVHPCATCGEPSLYDCSEACQGCDDPARQTALRGLAIRPEGVTPLPPAASHNWHIVREWRACREHNPLTEGPAQ